MTDMEQREEERRKDLQRLQSLRPMDDEFMRCLFKDNLPLAQFVLRILIGKPDLVLTRCETQKDMKRLAGARSVCLDAYGTDEDGKKYDLEVQRSDKGAEPHRARYHSSVIDVENLDAGQPFHALPDSYIIFIMEKDIFGLGKAVYPIERMNLASGKLFEDGEHILYVNGQYRGDSDIGRLMHDFCCTQADQMHFPLMAERTRYLKENPEGVSEVSKILEDMREEALQIGIQKGREDLRKSIVLHMLQAGNYPLEEISDISGLSLDEVKKLSTDRTA